MFLTSKLCVKKIQIRWTSSRNTTKQKIAENNNKKSPLNLSVKMLGYFDEKKKKDKIPSVFIYNTGAINIIATKKHILIKTYHFIKNNLEKWWDNIVEKKIIYNDDILLNDPLFKSSKKKFS